MVQYIKIDHHGTSTFRNVSVESVDTKQNLASRAPALRRNRIWVAQIDSLHGCPNELQTQEME